MQLLVVHHVDLVEEHDDGGHADLAGEEDVLAGLGHDGVGGGDDEHRAVHLGRAGDHVLDVVRVSRAVDVRVVPLLRLVLHVPRVDRDAPRLLFGGVVDVLVLHQLVAVLLRAVHGDRCRERRLAMVDVTDGAHVDVRLRPDKLLLRHRTPPCSAPRVLRGIR